MAGVCAWKQFRFHVHHVQKDLCNAARLRKRRELGEVRFESDELENAVGRKRVLEQHCSREVGGAENFLRHPEFCTTCMGTTFGCENETRCHVKTFEEPQAQPRFFGSSDTNCHVSPARVRLLASSPVVCVRILICVTVRFVLFPTVMLHLSTSAVLRTECHVASAPLSDHHLWRTSHREKVFHADALRIPVPARSDFAFRTPGISYHSFFFALARKPNF